MRARVPFSVCVVLLGLVGSASAEPEPLKPADVPLLLRPWIPWVLRDQVKRRCPQIGDVDKGDDDDKSDGDEASGSCAWAGKLSLDLSRRGGRFAQDWELFDTDEVRLPGGEGRWPVDVRVDGKPAVVLDHEGPKIRLKAGRHKIAGAFVWTALPDALALSDETGIVGLTVNGERVDFPERDDGKLLLTAESAAAPEGEDAVPEPPEEDEPDANEADSIEIVVNRLVDDDVPLRLTTSIALQISGKPRELILARALPPGFSPLSLQGDLPTRFEPDGRLRIQARRGNWTLTLVGRSAGPVASIARPDPKGLPWDPDEEVWVFKAEPGVRTVEVQGVPAVDPKQTTVSEAWRAWPAYIMAPTATFRLVETHRGAAEPPPDKLALARTLWLDFDGRGFTARDELTGQAHRARRLTMSATAHLGRVTVGGEDQIITRLAGGGDGIELRGGAVALSSESRIEHGPRGLAAVSWDHELESVSTRLNLPGGWRLLHVTGAKAADTWLGGWSLVGALFVFVAAAVAVKLYGLRGGVLTFVTLALFAPDSGDTVSIVLALLVAHALWRALAGPLRRWLARLRARPPGRPNRRLVVAVVAGVAGLVVVLRLLTVGGGSREDAASTPEPVRQARFKAEEGKMGRKTSRDKDALARMAAEEQAKNAGLLDLLKKSEPNPAASLFGRDSAIGSDAEDVLGGLVGSGGGGIGEGTLGLGNLGTIGKGGGDGGNGSGTGRGAGGLGGRRARAPDVVPGAANVRGSLDKEIVRRVVRRHLNEVKFCYEPELAKTPGLGGRVAVQFTIAASGQVIASVLQSSTMGNARVESCVVQAVRRWEFPKPLGGGIVIVAHPFTFSPGGGGSSEAPAPSPKPAVRVVRQAPSLAAYDPNALVQTGPGLPTWVGSSFDLSFDQPVPRTHTFSLWLLPPWANSVLVNLRTALLGLLGIVALGGPRRVWGWMKRLRREAVAGAVVVLLVLVCGASSPARAELSPPGGPAPPKELLDELRAALVARPPYTEPPFAAPKCAPDCVDLGRLIVEASPGRLRLRAEISAEARWTILLPGSRAHWVPATVLLDGKPTSTLGDEDGQLRLVVTPGAHQVVLEGPLPDRDDVQLDLPRKPHSVEKHLSGFELEGLGEDGEVKDALILRQVRRPAAKTKAERRRGAPEPTAAEGGGAAAGAQNLPPFMLVERTISMALKWEVRTRVTRLTQGGSAVAVEVPLLAGEAPTSEDLRVVAGKAQVNLATDEDSTEWVSTFEPKDTLELVAARSPSFVEAWTVVPGPTWHVEHAGLPSIGTSLHEPQWRPWPGEKVSLVITRPAGAGGATVTLLESQLVATPGERLTTTTLRFKLRSSRTQKHVITLPPGAELTALEVGGQEKPAQADGGKVTLELVAGEQEISLAYRTPGAALVLFRSSLVDLGVAGVNAAMSVVPGERWVLAVGGPGKGPSVGLWWTLVPLLVLALLLGRSGLTPLGVGGFVALVAGLAPIVDPLGVCLILGFFVAVGLRRLYAGVARAWVFDLRQVALVLFAVVAGLVLLGAVLGGLKSAPQMDLTGGSSPLDWLVDRAEARSSAPWVLSLPIVVYRIVMVVWTAWLGVSLVRWSRWLRTSFTAGGAWRPLVSPPPTIEIEEAMPEEPPRG